MTSILTRLFKPSNTSSPEVIRRNNIILRQICIEQLAKQHYTALSNPSLNPQLVLQWNTSDGVLNPIAVLALKLLRVKRFLPFKLISRK